MTERYAELKQLFVPHIFKDHERELVLIDGLYKRVAWIHIKSGHEYKKLGQVYNATNGAEGQMMVLYTNGAEGRTPIHTFVRELGEFERKFRRVVFEPKCFICGTTEGLWHDAVQGRGTYRCHGGGCVAF